MKKRIVVATIAFLFPAISLACSCVQRTPELYFKDADIIFEGVVTQKSILIGGAPISQRQMQYEDVVAMGDLLVDFTVKNVWKGNVEGRTSVYTATIDSLCGVPFEINKSYLIYAYKKDGAFRTNSCSGTELLNEESEKIRYLSNASGKVVYRCDDTDGGDVPYISGKASLNGGLPRVDTCLEENPSIGVTTHPVDQCRNSDGSLCSLEERVCVEKTIDDTSEWKIQTLVRQCPYGCSNGACIQGRDDSAGSGEADLSLQIEIERDQEQRKIIYHVKTSNGGPDDARPRVELPYTPRDMVFLSQESADTCTTDRSMNTVWCDVPTVAANEEQTIDITFRQLNCNTRSFDVVGSVRSTLNVDKNSWNNQSNELRLKFTCLEKTTSVMCAKDNKTCPDGSIVQRDPNRNCEYAQCPVLVAYGYASWECHDGTQERKEADLRCLSQYYWEEQAKSTCVDHCNAETGDCGLKTISLRNKCHAEKETKIRTYLGQEDTEEKNTLIAINRQIQDDMQKTLTEHRDLEEKHYVLLQQLSDTPFTAGVAADVSTFLTEELPYLNEKDAWERYDVLRQQSIDEDFDLGRSPFRTIEWWQWFTPAVRHAKERGWIKGEGGTGEYFYHDKPGLCQVGVVLLARLEKNALEGILAAKEEEYEEEVETDSEDPDVQRSVASTWLAPWAQYAVAALESKGVTIDVTCKLDSLLREGNENITITRGQWAQLITQTFSLPVRDAIDDFSDVTGETPVLERYAIGAVKDAGIMSGLGDEKILFGPSDTLRQADFAQTLVNIEKYLESHAETDQ